MVILVFSWNDSLSVVTIEYAETKLRWQPNLVRSSNPWEVNARTEFILSTLKVHYHIRCQLKRINKVKLRIMLE